MTCHQNPVPGNHGNHVFLFLFILLRIRQSGFFLFRINLKQTGRTSRTGDRPEAMPLPAQDNTNTQKNADIHPCLASIRTHDSGVQQAKNISCLRLRGHRNRPIVY
jgi:hypothetical protein